MNVQIFYNNTPRNEDYEIIISSFTKLVAQVIELPETIEVCLQYMDKNVHGGIDRVRMNRLAINLHLPLQDVPKILTHELIHVHQKFKGILKIDRHGVCSWHGIRYTDVTPENFSYDEYMNLPWEVDVRLKQDSVFSQALQLYNKA